MAVDKPKLGIDATRSRDIMDDMVNVVRLRLACLTPPLLRVRTRFGPPLGRSLSLFFYFIFQNSKRSPFLFSQTRKCNSPIAVCITHLTPPLFCPRWRRTSPMASTRLKSASSLSPLVNSLSRLRTATAPPFFDTTLTPRAVLKQKRTKRKNKN